jgi:DNA-binding PadR family transcriptional regulator
MGRHGGGRRFGRGGHGFFGRGGDDFPGARRLSSQDLQLVILALLAEKPAHGYELIKIVEERSDGFYTPSPGVIYPALTYLEEVGHAGVEQDGGRKLYSITPQGEAYLAEQRATADAILQALSRIGRRMDEVREAFAGVSDLDGGASDELHRARHNLKRALRSMQGSDSAEARRIAAILDRAAAEILGK